MKAMISATIMRAAGDSHLEFQVDENNFFVSGDRVVSKVDTLDGKSVVTDWGFAEGRKEITMKIVLSVDDYETLVDFQEDNVVSFVFLYRIHAYNIVLRTVTKGGLEGDKVVAMVKMDVVDKHCGSGEYSV